MYINCVQEVSSAYESCLFGTNFFLMPKLRPLLVEKVYFDNFKDVLS